MAVGVRLTLASEVASHVVAGVWIGKLSWVELAVGSYIRNDILSLSSSLGIGCKFSLSGGLGVGGVLSFSSQPALSVIGFFVVFLLTSTKVSPASKS